MLRACGACVSLICQMVKASLMELFLLLGQLRFKKL